MRLATLTGLLLALGVVGCGGSTDGSPPSDASNASDRSPTFDATGDGISEFDGFTTDALAADGAASEPDDGGFPEASCVGATSAPDGACYSASMIGEFVTPTCVSGDPPQMQGGPIEDGTYVMQSLTYYGTCGDLTPVQANWIINGSSWSAGEWVAENPSIGFIGFEGLMYSAVVEGSRATLCASCPIFVPLAIDRYSFTASLGTLMLFTIDSPGTSEVATFVKQ
jgi:hypothetical protein